MDAAADCQLIATDEAVKNYHEIREDFHRLEFLLESWEVWANDSDFSLRDTASANECLFLLEKLRLACSKAEDDVLEENRSPKVIVQGIMRALGLRKVLMGLFAYALKNKDQAARNEFLLSCLLVAIGGPVQTYFHRKLRVNFFLRGALLSWVCSGAQCTLSV